MFWLDESVFSADGCVFLSPSFPQQPTLFLCLRPYTTFLKWIRMLRSRTIFQDVAPALIQTGISPHEPNSQISLLSIEIDKFRSETLKTDMMYSANVLLNGVKVGSSNSFAPTGNKSATELPVVVIDSKFVIPWVPLWESLQTLLPDASPRAALTFSFPSSGTHPLGRRVVRVESLCQFALTTRQNSSTRHPRTPDSCSVPNGAGSPCYPLFDTDLSSNWYGEKTPQFSYEAVMERVSESRRRRYSDGLLKCFRNIWKCSCTRASRTSTHWTRFTWVRWFEES